MSTPRIDRALERAQEDAARPTLGAPDGRPRQRRLAFGDPQAPLARLLEILDRHDALGDDGRVRGEVELVSMGDHFDWGKPEERTQATADGLALLAWLAAHPADRVRILVGNHDLARVCELAGLDDATFRRARDEADAVYLGRQPTADEHAAFAAKHPFAAIAEAVARDLSTFSEAQRALVCRVLEAKRVRLALAPADDLLLIHGAVTEDDLGALGVSPGGGARAIAQALNGFLDRVLEGWDGREPLDLHPLHQPASAAHGDGRGILFQRPAHPSRSDLAELQGPPRRRFDPRTLPRGLSQAVGHVRDDKCRSLLGEWVADPAPPEGPLRTLRADRDGVRYRSGRPDAARGAGEAELIFLDGGMYWAPPERYELLDLESRRPATRR